ncbi:MAG: hypothetical protein ACK5JU_02620 [Bacteroidales bacterium]
MIDFLRKWDIVRLIRLVAGVGFGIYAVVSKEYMFLFLAGLFLLQAIFNVGCCGCSTPGCESESSSSRSLYKDVIKPYKPK